MHRAVSSFGDLGMGSDTEKLSNLKHQRALLRQGAPGILRYTPLQYCSLM